VHAKLGWQVFNAAHADSSNLLQYLPSPHGLELWLSRAISLGVSEDLARRLKGAITHLREVTDRHAGDARLFDLLLDANSDIKAEHKWRKQAFDANSFIFGARARALIGVGILFPSAKAGWFDMVRINGFIDLLRTREDVRWPISTSVTFKDNEPTRPSREPLDLSESGAVPVLRDFSSSPLPILERRVDGETIIDQVAPAVVGLTGVVSLMTGEILRNVGPIESDKNEFAHFGLGIRTPAEVVYCDHIVHTSLFPEVRRELCVYGELASETAHQETDRLKVSDPLVSMGRAVKKLGIDELGQYGSLIQMAFERIGADPSEFVVYRARIKYPPLPASVMIRHPMPLMN
jgi:hypothetical protein